MAEKFNTNNLKFIKPTLNENGEIEIRYLGSYTVDKPLDGIWLHSDTTINGTINVDCIGFKCPLCEVVNDPEFIRTSEVTFEDGTKAILNIRKTNVLELIEKYGKIVLSEKAISLLVDIAYRIPRRKLFVSNYQYVMWDETALSKVHVNHSHVNELILSNYLRLNHLGGIGITQEGIDAVDQYITKKTVKNSHNRDVEVSVLPDPYI